MIWEDEVHKVCRRKPTRQLRASSDGSDTIRIVRISNSWVQRARKGSISDTSGD